MHGSPVRVRTAARGAAWSCSRRAVPRDLRVRGFADTSVLQCAPKASEHSAQRFTRLLRVLQVADRSPSRSGQGACSRGAEVPSYCIPRAFVHSHKILLLRPLLLSNHTRLGSRSDAAPHDNLGLGFGLALERPEAGRGRLRASR